MDGEISRNNGYIGVFGSGFLEELSHRTMLVVVPY
jgi:hypothetical protein